MPTLTDSLFPTALNPTAAGVAPVVEPPDGGGGGLGQSPGAFAAVLDRVQVLPGGAERQDGGSRKAWVDTADVGGLASDDPPGRQEVAAAFALQWAALSRGSAVGRGLQPGATSGSSAGGLHELVSSVSPGSSTSGAGDDQAPWAPVMGEALPLGLPGGATPPVDGVQESPASQIVAVNLSPRMSVLTTATAMDADVDSALVEFARQQGFDTQALQLMFGAQRGARATHALTAALADLHARHKGLGGVEGIAVGGAENHFTRSGGVTLDVPSMRPSSWSEQDGVSRESTAGATDGVPQGGGDSRSSHPADHAQSRTGAGSATPWHPIMGAAGVTPAPTRSAPPGIDMTNLSLGAMAISGISVQSTRQTSVADSALSRGDATVLQTGIGLDGIVAPGVETGTPAEAASSDWLVDDLRSGSLNGERPGNRLTAGVENTLRMASPTSQLEGQGVEAHETRHSDPVSGRPVPGLFVPTVMSVRAIPTSTPRDVAQLHAGEASGKSRTVLTDLNPPDGQSEVRGAARGVAWARTMDALQQRAQLDSTGPGGSGMGRSWSSPEPIDWMSGESSASGASIPTTPSPLNTTLPGSSSVGPLLVSSQDSAPVDGLGSMPSGTAEALRTEVGPLDLRAHLDEQQEALSRRLGEAVAHRVLDQIERGHWNLRLTVMPEHLGPIDIDLTVSGQTVEAQFQVSNAQTQALIQDSVPRLREAVGASGMDLASVWVSGGWAERHRGNPTPGQRDDTASVMASGGTDDEAAGSGSGSDGVERSRSTWTPGQGALDILI